MSQNVNLEAKGLYISPNPLTLPDGALLQADNAIIRRDNIIESIRGFKTYGDALGSYSHASQLMEYKNRLIRHYDDVLEFDDGTGRFTPFVNPISSASANRVRFQEFNGNLYMTTSDGIQKLSSKNSDQLDTGTIKNELAGIPRALPCETIDTHKTGFLSINPEATVYNDVAVRYAVVWGKRDSNDNLLLGAPSQNAVAYYDRKAAIVDTFNKLVLTLENSYAYTGANAFIKYDTVIHEQLPWRGVLNYTDSLDDIYKKIFEWYSAFILGTSGQFLPTFFESTLVFMDNRGVGFSPNRVWGVVPFTAATTEVSGVKYLTITVPVITGHTLQEFYYKGQWVYCEDFISTGTTPISKDGLNKQYSSLFKVEEVTDTTLKINLDGVLASTFAVNPTVTVTTAYVIYGDLASIVIPELSAESNTTLTDLCNFLNQLIEKLVSYRISYTMNSIPISTGVGSVTVAGATCTMIFSAPITSYLKVNDIIYVEGIKQGVSEIKGDFKVLSVASDTITFTVSMPAGTYVVLDNTTVDKMIVMSEGVYDNYFKLLAPSFDTTVEVKINIPDIIDTSYFYQIYRSYIAMSTATEPPVPTTEMYQVYEGYPTSSDITNGYIKVEDIVEETVLGSVPLYTNAYSGEGILQANTPIPYARDVNRFKDYQFLSNTRQYHYLNNQLLGIHDIANGNLLSIISKDFSYEEYKFVTGAKEKNVLSVFPSSIAAGDYLVLSSSGDRFKLALWFVFNGVGVQPTLAGMNAYERVDVIGGELASTTVSKIASAIAKYEVFSIDDFPSGIYITVMNNEDGTCTAPYVKPASIGIVISNTTVGAGEDASQGQIGISSNPIPTAATEETTQSMLRVINARSSRILGEYLSNSSVVGNLPGQFVLYATELQENPFYLLASSDGLGNSFSKSLKNTAAFTATAGNPTVVSSVLHGLVTGDYVLLMGSNELTVNGIFQVTKITNDTFSISLSTSSPAITGYFKKASTSIKSENDAKVNRLYYSKYLQPEAVPYGNYLVVGQENKAILRIFPLRDSLFVFKEDGLWRISGAVTPFNVDLFDASCVLCAPDTVDVANNVIYAWTTQGIAAITESGVNNISRNIDTEILKLASKNFTNFPTATWGYGYNSDNAFYFWTITNTYDTVATQCFRYSNLTESWTKVQHPATCGIVLTSDDKMYLGSGTLNYIEQERKNFDRTDYANREFTTSLVSSSRYLGNTIQLPSVVQFKPWDVLAQKQIVSVYDFNSLIAKLDLDYTTRGNSGPLYTSLAMAAGDNYRAKLVALATAIDSDVGGTTFSDAIATLTSIPITSISLSNPSEITFPTNRIYSGRYVQIGGSTTTPAINGVHQISTVGAYSDTKFTIDAVFREVLTEGTFSTLDSDYRDVAACYNILIRLLNVNSGIVFSNYMEITDEHELETPITAIDYVANKITIQTPLQFVLGDMTIYEGIDSVVVYRPESFKNPSAQKHVRDAILMLENLGITNGTISFASDLLPSFDDIPFTAQGIGTFGSGNFGTGFFGGTANAAHVRTLIPSNKQRNRYLLLKFNHRTAREYFAITGITLTASDSMYTKGYR